MENLLLELEKMRNIVECWAGLAHKNGKLEGLENGLYDLSLRVRAAEQSVQRIAFGKGVLARLGNLFIRFGWWLAEIGNR